MWHELAGLVGIVCVVQDAVRDLQLQESGDVVEDGEGDDGEKVDV